MQFNFHCKYWVYRENLNSQVTTCHHLATSQEPYVQSGYLHQIGPYDIDHIPLQLLRVIVYSKVKDILKITPSIFYVPDVWCHNKYVAVKSQWHNFRNKIKVSIWRYTFWNPCLRILCFWLPNILFQLGFHLNF